jgi:hypothetical protein
MADWDTVRQIASSLPGAEESTTYGQPAFKVGGKLFAWISPDRHAEGALALRIDLDEKELAIAASSGVFFQTAHYEGYPILLVRLAPTEPCSRRGSKRAGSCGPKRLADAYLADSG